MKRSLGRLAAWTLATVASIAIANAAVGSVRNQVSDLPQAVPANLATTVVPIPTSPTTASTFVEPATSTPSTTVIDTSSTVVTVASTSTTAPAATTAATTTTTAANSQVKTYSVTGGRVTIEVYSDRIELLGAVPDPGYSVAEVEQSTTQIEIEFKSGEIETKFKAHLEGGELTVQVEGDD